MYPQLTTTSGTAIEDLCMQWMNDFLLKPRMPQTGTGRVWNSKAQAMWTRRQVTLCANKRELGESTTQDGWTTNSSGEHIIVCRQVYSIWTRPYDYYTWIWTCRKQKARSHSFAFISTQQTYCWIGYIVVLANHGSREIILAITIMICENESGSTSRLWKKQTQMNMANKNNPGEKKTKTSKKKKKKKKKACQQLLELDCKQENIRSVARPPSSICLIGHGFSLKLSPAQLHRMTSLSRWHSRACRRDLIWQRHYHIIYASIYRYIRIYMYSPISYYY